MEELIELINSDLLIRVDNGKMIVFKNGYLIEGTTINNTIKEIQEIATKEIENIREVDKDISETTTTTLYADGKPIKKIIDYKYNT